MMLLIRCDCIKRAIATVGETKTSADVVRVLKTWSGHRPSNAKVMSTSIVKNAIVTTREIKSRQR